MGAHSFGLAGARALIALCAVPLLLATACSSDSGTSASGAEPSTTPASSDTSPPTSSSTSEPSTTTSTPTETEVTPTGPPRTSCTRVVYVGESTSLGLIGPYTIAKAKHRLPAQLRKFGVKDVRTDILGARSIIEKWHNQPNAQDAVMTQKQDGYDGCWVIAMGTNEAANQAAGSTIGSKDRIDLLMKEIGKDQPVLWLTVKTLVRDGYYDDENMRGFNEALLKACDRYPDLRVFDWRSEVEDKWFIDDGIHYTSDGYQERAHRIARALAVAFPEDQDPAPECVVTSETDR